MVVAGRAFWRHRLERPHRRRRETRGSNLSLQNPARARCRTPRTSHEALLRVVVVLWRRFPLFAQPLFQRAPRAPFPSSRASVFPLPKPSRLPSPALRFPSPVPCLSSPHTPDSSTSPPVRPPGRPSRIALCDRTRRAPRSRKNRTPPSPDSSPTATPCRTQGSAVSLCAVLNTGDTAQCLSPRGGRSSAKLVPGVRRRRYNRFCQSRRSRLPFPDFANPDSSRRRRHPPRLRRRLQPPRTKPTRSGRVP
mmetsp:Transcript_2849/g.9950  ORF Transcript_2849/g.9950 Transcript_2849/m.9950 type:complete len:250 (-) Transcript_2849:574-1323(-)